MCRGAEPEEDTTAMQGPSGAEPAAAGTASADGRRLASEAALAIRKAEEPGLLSARDGKLLRRVPSRVRASNGDLVACLRAALGEVPGLEAALKAALSARGMAAVGATKSMESMLYTLRAHAYRIHGQALQAVADGRNAVSGAPRDPSHGEEGAAAHVALGLALASSAQHAPAAQQLRLALDALGCRVSRGGTGVALDTSALPVDDRAAAEWVFARYQDTCARLTEDQRVALDAGGAAGLDRWMQVESERQLPEVLRSHPPNFYYYEWMRHRLAEQFPEGLPAPVQDKLLAMDADELDLLLEHPAAVRDRVSLLEGVLREGGEAAMSAYVPPALAWEDVRALVGPDAVGLGLGNAPTGALAVEGPGGAPVPVAALPGTVPGSLTGAATAVPALPGGSGSGQDAAGAQGGAQGGVGAWSGAGGASELVGKGNDLEGLD